MKKISFLILMVVIFVSFLNFAKADTGLQCNLEEVIINNSEFDYNNCTFVTVTSLNNIDYLKRFNQLEAIEFKEINIQDVSFINELNVEKISFNGLKVNMDNINSNSIKEVECKHCYIENDNFGVMENLPNLEYLSINGYFNSLNNISKLSVLNNLKLSINNYGKIYDITPLYSLTNLNRLFVAEYYYTEDFINHLKNNNIIYKSTDEDDNVKQVNINNIKEVDEFYNSLNLEGLTDLQKIITISNAINKKMHYGSLINDTNTFFADFLLGFGVCNDYAYMTAYFLNKAGFLTYEITSIMDENTHTNHAYNLIYYNGKWYAIDNTWTDKDAIVAGEDYIIKEEDLFTAELSYFMVDPKDAIFYQSVFHHPLADLYEYTDFKINISYETNYEVSKETDIINLYEKFTPSDMERDGYLFLGWYKDKELTEMYNPDEYINYNSIVLYAKWEKMSETDPVIIEGGNPTTGAFLNYTAIGMSFSIATLIIFNNKRKKRIFNL